MKKLHRRSALRGSLALVAAGALGRPHIANAEAKTATLWWTQGFVKEEDAAFKRIAADYEKASGNKLAYTLLPFGPLGQKVISALTSGDVPDLISYDGAQARVLPQNAWVDRAVDMTDVVETQRQHYHPTTLLAAQYYNNVEKRRTFYLAPYKTAVAPIHIWNSLVEKAGFKLADAPGTWDAYFDFFKPMQKRLRELGQRSVYSLGLQITTTGPADGNALFHHFMIAHGGKDIVTPDGRPHLADPQVKQAIVETITYLTTAYKDGYVPPGALSWSDADDNNAFHAKQLIMDLDGTISTEVALFHEKDRYDDIVTMALPNDNHGKPVPAQLGVGGGFIPKGAKNIAVAKDFMRYLIQPEVVNGYLKDGLGRWLPAMPELAKTDPFWLAGNDKHREAYTREGVLGPTVPSYSCYNPGYAEVEAAQLWGMAHADVIREGQTPQAAADRALKRIGEILAKYPVGQA